MKSRAKAPSALSTSYRAAALAAVVACLAALGPLAGSASALPQPPEGRGYELVSPRDAGGVFPTLPFVWSTPSFQHPTNPASPDGERLLFITPMPLPGSTVTQVNFPYLAARGGGGWSTEYVGAPGDVVDISRLAGATADLSTIISAVADSNAPLGGSLDPADVDPEEDLYAWEGAPLSWASPPLMEPSAFKMSLFDVAREARVWVYAGATTGVTPFTVLTETGPEAVSIVPGGPVQKPTLDTSVDAGARLSDDGNRVAFRSKAFDDTGPFRVWVRIRDEQRTVLASDNEAGVVSADLDASPDYLTPDGSAVFFTTLQQLTPDDTDAQRDLYRFDVDSEDTELVSAAAPGAPSDGQAEACASTYGVPGCEVSPGTYSDDGSVAYFVSPEQLDSGASAGAPNLYLREAGQTRLVAVLDAADAPAGSEGTWRAQRRTDRPVRINSDGSRIVIESHAQLTAYDNEDKAELYVYDAAAGTIECASCGPELALGPNADADLRNLLDSNQPLPVFQGNWGVQGRNLANEGAQIYFQTPERLVAKDVNGKMDVYEYDVAKDEITLISSGSGSSPSLYIDNSTDGEDVFFFSTDLLVPESQDQNGENWKIFDARIGGGFPEPPPGGCAPGACRGVSGPPAPFAAPASGNVSGAGNMRARRSCGATARRAARLSRHAKSLRRRAARTTGKRSRSLRRRSKSQAKRAHGLSRQAKRCRGNNRRASR